MFTASADRYDAVLCLFSSIGYAVTLDGRVELEGTVSRLTFEYEIVRDGSMTAAREVHELGLFTRAERERAFASAGLSVAYDPVGLTGRGLYRAR